MARSDVVTELRKVAIRVMKEGGTAYFPPKEGRETQPVRLEGYVSNKKVGDLVYYIADMLEE